MPSQEEMLKIMSQHIRGLYAVCSVPVIDEVGETGEFMMPMEDGVKLRTLF